MNNLVKIFTLLLISAMLCSCGSINTSNVPKTMPFKTDGIILNFKGDPMLNLYQNLPHALVVCAYQLKDLHSFNQILEEKDGMSKLLECNRFDTSAIFAKQYVVQPGKNLRATMDRFEGTEHLGIIAGYYNLKNKSVTSTFPIPIRGFLFFKGPRVLVVDLDFGPQEIKVKDTEAEKNKKDANEAKDRKG
jgi:type VI secretion system VasD/TssJ family lipoprotein